MIPRDHLKVEDVTPERHGMQAGLGPTRVRVTHLPTGIVAEHTDTSQMGVISVCITMIEEALTNPRLARWIRRKPTNLQ